jgi:hypothetical protein
MKLTSRNTYTDNTKGDLTETRWKGVDLIFSSGLGKLQECNELPVLLKRVLNTYKALSFSRTTKRSGVSLICTVLYSVKIVIVNEKRTFQGV